MDKQAALKLLDHPIISERYFFPRPGRPRRPLLFEGVDGTRLCCSESKSEGADLTLVHFHGNGEIVADYDDGYQQALAALGVNVMMLEYRGYGDSGGTSQLGKMLQDVACLREQCGLEPARTVVYGRSVGAIFAVEWASQQPGLGGLILESGVADPYQRLAIRLSAAELGVTDQELRKACELCLDHRRKLSAYSGPLLVLHAERDSLVGAEHARAHMEYYQGERGKLVLFPRGDHNTVLGANWSEYLQELGQFLSSL